MGQVVDKHHVNILYTAPTAIRALMADGDKAIEGSNRRSLKIMGSARSFARTRRCVMVESLNIR